LVQYLQSYLDEIKADGSILGRYKIDLNKTTTSVVDSISSVFKYSVDAFLALFDNAVSLMVVIVATFYMVLEVASINKAILFFVPKHHQAYINELIDLIRQKTGMWLRGQLILCLVVGLCAYAGLVFLDVKYALILALLFGIGELIPYLGPSIAAVPAVFLAFMQERSLGLSVIGLYVIIQVLENNFIVPAVMRKVVGINPIVTIFALLIGGKVAGVIGMVLAIPVVTAINIIIASYFDSQEKKEENIAEANL
jgi:predicted PurR-regulated permease PerM